uniref:RNA methyltransferase n=1 Tax=Desulfatirhabdium butyrativorans TaxID=340467 RepID=A0A7C4VSM2_9BACT
MALIHHPVKNREGLTIASAVTNLDIHDLARAGRTFDVERIYIVTPLVDQQALVRQIVDHWMSGYGGIANPDRKEALQLIAIRDSLMDVRTELMRSYSDERLLTVATTARKTERTVSHVELRQWLEAGNNCLLLFGTAWGLADEVLQTSDRILTPITGRGSYNHLSVRSAVSIVLDRLVNPR